MDSCREHTVCFGCITVVDNRLSSSCAHFMQWRKNVFSVLVSWASDLFLPLVSVSGTAESLYLRQAGSALFFVPRQAPGKWMTSGAFYFPFFWNRDYAIPFMFIAPFTCLFCNDLLKTLPFPSWSWRQTQVTKLSSKCSYPTEPSCIRTSSSVISCYIVYQCGGVGSHTHGQCMEYTDTLKWVW